MIFLAEAFTRSHVMYSLATDHFNESYTYFTWRNTAAELQEYSRRSRSRLSYRGIDPHKHSVWLQRELFAHLVLELLGVDRGLRVNTGRLQFFKDAEKSVLLGCRVAPDLRIAAPGRIATL